MSKKSVIFSIITILLFILDGFIRTGIMFIISCFLYIFGTLQIMKDAKGSSIKEKFLLSLYIFVWTFVIYTVLNVTLPPLGPSAMILLYFWGAQAIAILVSILRPYIMISIILSSFLSFLYYSING